MNRTVLLVGATGLAAIAVAAVLLPTRSGGVRAAELPALPEQDPAAAGPALAILAIPPPPDGTDSEGAPASGRRPVVGPSDHDYEALYGPMTGHQRSLARVQVQERLQRATAARFDELHAAFDQLRAEGQYGARVVGSGQNPFS